MIASGKHNASRHHGIVSLIIMSVPLSMDRYNHLHGIKGDLRDVEVLAPQQPMYVMEVNGERIVFFQVEVLLGGPHNEFLHA